MPYKLTNVSDYKGKTKHFNNVLHSSEKIDWKNSSMWPKFQLKLIKCDTNNAIFFANAFVSS
jgi:hypothetical protein